MIRTGKEWSGLAMNNEDGLGMIRVGLDWSRMISNV